MIYAFEEDSEIGFSAIESTVKKRPRRPGLHLGRRIWELKHSRWEESHLGRGFEVRKKTPAEKMDDFFRLNGCGA